VPRRGARWPPARRARLPAWAVEPAGKGQGRGSLGSRACRERAGAGQLGQQSLQGRGRGGAGAGQGGAGTGRYVVKREAWHRLRRRGRGTGARRRAPQLADRAAATTRWPLAGSYRRTARTGRCCIHTALWSASACPPPHPNPSRCLPARLPTHLAAVDFLLKCCHVNRPRQPDHISRRREGPVAVPAKRRQRWALRGRATGSGSWGLGARHSAAAAAGQGAGQMQCKALAGAA
jgi:hypothetical protein